MQKKREMSLIELLFLMKKNPNPCHISGNGDGTVSVEEDAITFG